MNRELAMVYNSKKYNNVFSAAAFLLFISQNKEKRFDYSKEKKTFVKIRLSIFYSLF